MAHPLYVLGYIAVTSSTFTHRCATTAAPQQHPAALAHAAANGTSCPYALSTILNAACELWSSQTRSDYCSASLPCTVAGNHLKWPTRALLGSQLTRRIDVIKAAHESGCAYAHVPLAEPAMWGERYFNLGACGHDTIGCSCQVAAATFGAKWRAIDPAGKFLRRGPSAPRLGSLLASLRTRLQPAPTPWYDDGGADELQVAVHLRRGDLASHGLESDQGRWVPDEYYEEILPRLVRALSAAAPVVVHICSEMATGWSPQAAARWETMLCAAGVRRVAFHLGEPWPAGWKSTNTTNADIMETFYHMIDADVLLTSVSGFSKAAAHYSAGLVLQLSGSQAAACQGRSDGGDAASCVHRLPLPPRCTASTEARLQKIQQEAEHVDYQCCFGRWRNATTRASHCIKGCLAIGDDIRARSPPPERRKHAVGEEPDDAMPMWTPVYKSWVWCNARSRADLLKQLHSAAKRTPWEASVRHAAAALVARKAAMHVQLAPGSASREVELPSPVWKSTWSLLLQSKALAAVGGNKARARLLGASCCRKNGKR